MCSNVVLRAVYHRKKKSKRFHVSGMFFCFYFSEAPEVLSIHFQNHSEPVHTLHGKNYTLICEIPNIAPVKNLIVNWYKEIKSDGRNNSSDIRKMVHEERFLKYTTKTPQSVFSTINIHANKSENGVQYWCEAELTLGAHGSRKMKSSTLSITVHCKFCSDEGKLIEGSLILIKGFGPNDQWSHHSHTSCSNLLIGWTSCILH